MHTSRSPVDAGEYGDTPDQATVGAAEQLRWFGTLWVLGLVFHYSDSQPFAALPVLVAGLPALLFPSSVAALGGFLAVGALVAVLHLPAASNHLVLSLLVITALAASALHVRLTRPRGAFVERWLDTARTPAGLVLLAVYAWTVFHKLNTAFLDPATSCAGHLLAQIALFNGLSPVEPDPTVVLVAAVGTVGVEALILVLLAVPGWQRWGVALGVGFHALLAPASFYDFATVVFALYLLLVPRQVFAELAPRSARLRRIMLGASGVHVLLSLGAGLAGTDVSPVGLAWHTLLVASWYVAVGALMVPLVRACLFTPAAWPRWRWRPGVLLLVPALALVNGAMPYLGVKTVASYSMFSNLHTEDGRTNHLVAGVGELVPYARDTVVVTAVRLPERVRLDAVTVALGGSAHLGRAARWAREPVPVRVPWLELRRTVLLWRDAGIRGVGVEYLRDGVPRTVVDATADVELAAPLPWWQRHLVALRAVDSGLGPDHCRW